MTDENSRDSNGDGLDRDLFGAPVNQMRDRWGRPSFAKNQENQLLVATLRAAGWSQMRIARYLGCDEKTLRKHFSRELQAGADLIEGQALQALVQNMRKGKMPAINKVLAVVADGAAAPPPRNPAPDPGAEDGKPAALGKKEQIAEHARKPGAAWGNLLN